MIVLRMAGKILLLPVWLLLATAHLLVKIDHHEGKYTYKQRLTKNHVKFFANHGTFGNQFFFALLRTFLSIIHFRSPFCNKNKL